MKPRRKGGRAAGSAAWGIVVLSLALAACGGGEPLLAEAQTLSHGTGGTGGFEEIRGKSANELLEYQRKSASRNIMAAHIQGYTAEQLQQIAAYLK